MMSKNKIYFLLFVLGLGLGIFFGLRSVRASSPEGETSGGEQPASVYYDEFWQATQAVVSTGSGYANFEPSTHNNTPKAGEIVDTPDGKAVNLFPKMVVTRWNVHGHIHFE